MRLDAFNFMGVLAGLMWLMITFIRKTCCHKRRQKHPPPALNAIRYTRMRSSKKKHQARGRNTPSDEDTKSTGTGEPRNGRMKIKLLPSLLRPYAGVIIACSSTTS
jgi:hypothetical protein